MKNVIQVLAVLMFSVVIHAQDNRTPGHFTGINVTGSFDVVLIKGKEGVTIHADKDAAKNIRTEVQPDGVLSISVEKGKKIRGEVKIKVYYEMMSQIVLNGSGDITNSEKLETQNLEISLIGSGDITLSLNTENIRADVDGSGDMKLEGKATNFDAKVIGSGDLQAINLKSENVKVKVLGSGDASVYASAAIEAAVTGSGDIVYAGNPPGDDTKVLGSGSIEKK